MKGFKGALEGFKSSLETLEITIGAGLLPVMTRLVQQASHGAQFVNDFATAVKGLGTDSNNARGGIVNAGNSAAHTGAQMTAGEKAAYQYADALAELKNDAHAIVSVFGSVVNALRSVGDANDWLGRKTMALNDTWSGLDAHRRRRRHVVREDGRVEDHGARVERSRHGPRRSAPGSRTASSAASVASGNASPARSRRRSAARSTP
jgi:hypothetical protein